ncbi:hypothetical protein [Actinomadura rudentiformis]|uniref:Uncharacterized protein n=1 Tax=Actinomadura rudentiformis TaxID=359158 RepID=A0A6H9Z5P6_9ACTN|nr:hypothetical protein [Actinomadura rudentiformis]KAB2350160.1 hypothetical protein F8566_10210 [Actinomadura rudentiformis]
MADSARATDPPGIPNVTGRPGWLRAASAVGRRWPTWLALAWAAISLADVSDGLEYMVLFVLPATGYLFLAVVDLPRITWAVGLAAMATVVVLRMLDINPWPALAVAVVTLAAVGLINGQLRKPGLYALQSPGALAFMAFGLLVLAVPTTVGGYLVAAGLLGHATWDAVHWRADKIVSRSFAEWCGVLDLVLGVGLLVVLLLR